jgi:hypothetical protein
MYLQIRDIATNRYNAKIDPYQCYNQGIQKEVRRDETS